MELHGDIFFIAREYLSISLSEPSLTIVHFVDLVLNENTLNVGVMPRNTKEKFSNFEELYSFCFVFTHTSVYEEAYPKTCSLSALPRIFKLQYWPNKLASLKSVLLSLRYLLHHTDVVSFNLI